MENGSATTFDSGMRTDPRGVEVAIIRQASADVILDQGAEMESEAEMPMVCPIHVVGGRVRLWSICGTMIGAGGGVIVTLGSSKSDDPMIPTQEFVILCGCLAGLFGAIAGLLLGFWRLKSIGRCRP